MASETLSMDGGLCSQGRVLRMVRKEDAVFGVVCMSDLRNAELGI
jgi:hypothetical protein